MSTQTVWIIVLVFFQAEDGIRDLVRSRGLGDVYKRQAGPTVESWAESVAREHGFRDVRHTIEIVGTCATLSLIHI